MLGDCWAALPEDEALRRVCETLAPRWTAWTVTITPLPGGKEQVTIWCGRRLADNALAHGDSPACLLAHIGDAEADAFGRRLRGGLLPGDSGG
jgi:hypothetical protein